jgi:hypothetical protein
MNKWAKERLKYPNNIRILTEEEIAKSKHPEEEL